MTTIKNLLELLVLHKGTIVCTANLKTNEINQAMASNRIYIDENSLGYVWMPEFKMFPKTIEEVKQFEKWFPLDEELPEDLKTLDWFDSVCRNEEKKIDNVQGNVVLPCVMASNYFLCEYYNWDGNKKIQAIEGESEEDVKHRIIGHGMELISVKRIYLS